VELLIQQMAAPVPIRELLPTRLIVRQSTWPREGGSAIR
jgi:DNA-binding LacI/PurR family transcriptional regulator